MPGDRPLFLLPSLAGLAEYVPDDAERVSEDSSQPPWQGWLDVATVDLLLRQLAPLLRGLLLAGYEVSRVELGIAASAGARPARWVEIVLATMEVAEVDTEVAWPDGSGGPWPDGSRVVVALAVVALLSAAGASLAIPPGPDGRPFPAGWSAESQNTLVLASEQPVARLGDLYAALESSELPALVDGLVDALVDRWEKGGLVPYDFVTPPGLLWIFNPTFWDYEPPLAVTPEALVVRDTAGKLLEAAVAEPPAFLRGQIVEHATRAEADAATLGGLLEQSYGRRLARNFRRDWFQAMEAQLLASVGIGDGRPPGVPSFGNVCGPRLLGYRSDVRWLEVILTVADNRLLPFPSLAHPDLPYDYELEEEPLEVTRTADEKGVEIRVFGCDPVVVRREYDLGYEVEQCFTWEYMGADPAGRGTLVIVAAPGVSVSGRENVPETCRLVVYRVQDHELVPAWGEHVSTYLIEGAYDRDALHWYDGWLLDDPDSGLPDAGEDAPVDRTGAKLAFRINRYPLGVRITHPAVDEQDAEFLLDVSVDESSPLQRYSFEITPVTDPNEFAGQLLPYTLVVRVTEGVKVFVRHETGSRSVIRDHYQVVKRREGWAPHQPLANVYPPGEPLSLDPAEMTRLGVTALPEGEQLDRQIWPGEKLLIQTLIDVGLGMTVVGNAVDVADFGLAFVTGRDKWGNPVSNGELLVMFGGAVLPFVSNGALRGVTAAAR
jgi:hypothetical protein